MTLIDFKDKFVSTLATLALLLGIGLSTTIALAHPQYDRGRGSRTTRVHQFNDTHPDLGGSVDLKRTALNAGANAGLKAGREDRRKGRLNEFRDEIVFLKATKDYNTKLGDLGLYKTYFREAFAHAYADGYAGN